MIIWVDDALFAPKAAATLDLLALLRNAARRRHTIVISEAPENRSQPHLKSWLQQLSEPLRAEVDIVLEQLNWVWVHATVFGAEWLLVTNRSRPEFSPSLCLVTLEKAVRAMGLPLFILVENELNDAAFLRQVMPSPWRERLKEWETSGLIRFENGGGLAVMRALVEYYCGGGGVHYFGLNGDLWRWSHFIIFDHDGDTATSPGDDSQKLTKCCMQQKMEQRHHRLERRDQEHYLPRQACSALLEQRPSAEANHLKEQLTQHFEQGERHFRPLPKIGDRAFFKNEFQASIPWQDAWFAADGSGEEMTRLAEKLAPFV